MKTYKKHFAGLVLAILPIAILFLLPHKAEAAPLTSDQLDKATYKLLNAAEIDGVIGGRTIKFFDANPTDDNHNFKPRDNTTFCDGTLFGSNGNLSDKLKGITLNVSFNDLAKFGGNAISALVNFNYLDSSGNCLVYQNSLIFTKQADGSWVAKEQPTGSDTSQTSDNQTCEANSGGSALAWINCPLLTAASDAITGQDGTGGLLGYFEDQLSFSVSKDLGPTTTQNQVKVTWGIFKNIATAILVVVMLIMVYSQATGAGPFEAYTTRKMLPRLVAIAILMQLSWVAVSWIIEIFNDLGAGLADLMYAPFGGSSNLTIFSLLSHAGLGDTGAVIINWVGIMALLTIGVAALPLVSIFALGAAAALLTAFMVLIFRKIIIILCLITAPIALAAYLLPGANRYWKLWQDNFIKVLAMFPLVVALVAAGRIFAYITATAGSGGVLLSFIFIIVGFFGPLFLLPKAFKWGGTLMAAGGGAIAGAMSRVGGKESFLGKGVQGFAERKQGEWAKQYNPEDKAFGLRKTKIPFLRVPTGRAVRRLQSGHILPTERSRRLTIAAGNQWAKERTDEAEALVGRSYEKALAGYDRHDVDENGNYVQVQRRQNASGDYLDVDGKVVDVGRAAFVNNDGSFVKDYENADKRIVSGESQASKVRLTGVEAAKQALVDIAGNDGSSDSSRRAAQAAHKQLLDTSSWIEVQKARIRGGNNSGRRVFEVDNFRDTLENSPQHYSATIRSRPDIAPDVIESAEAAERITYDEAYKQHDVNAIRRLDKKRLMTTLERLGPDAVPSLHFGIFEDIARLQDAEVSNLLAERLQTFKDSGTTVGSNAIGSLTGAQMQSKVEDALKYASGSPKLEVFLPGRGSGPPPSGGSVPPTGIVIPPTYRPQTPRGESEEEGGGIDIPHEDS